MRAPQAWVAPSSSLQRTPAWARALRPTGSISTYFISERSMTRPPSQTAALATLCPPPRTAATSSCSWAKWTAATTSIVSQQSAMIAGRRSMRPFQTLRAASYLRSSGHTSLPCSRSRKAASAPGRSVHVVDLCRVEAEVGVRLLHLPANLIETAINKAKAPISRLRLTKDNLLRLHS